MPLVIPNWNRLLREEVESPSLEKKSKRGADLTLGDMVPW